MDHFRIYESHNLQHIIRFVEANNLLKIIFKPCRFPSRHPDARRPPRDDPLLQAIQVVCAPLLLSLNEHLLHDHFGFPDSQQFVYSRPRDSPIFGGQHGLDVNLAALLHFLNFWKYHMVREVEQTLFAAFNHLHPDERPQWWDSKLQQDAQTMGRHWKGSFAYIDDDELVDVRGWNESDKETAVIQDKFEGENDAFEFGDLQLEMIPKHKMKWPEAFERHLHSLTPSPPASPSGVRTRAQKRGGGGGTPEDLTGLEPQPFRFEGGGEGDDAFHATGWAQPLPKQQGIPGWQRLTMMKYFVNDQSELWAYEGVVLPGGKIIVGRWWNPLRSDEEAYSGPFIFWCVDGAAGYECRFQDGEEHED